MKINKVLSFFLALVMVLSCFPSMTLFAGAEETSATDPYQNGYTWSFDIDKEFTGDDKGGIMANAERTAAVMSHEAYASIASGRNITSGMLTTLPTNNWGNTVCNGVFYKLPADLETGKTYKLSLNLYGKNEQAKLNNIFVSFGHKETEIFNEDKRVWNIDQFTEAYLGTEAKIEETYSYNLAQDSTNKEVLEIEVSEAIAAAAKKGSWMMIMVPLEVNGEYKFGSMELAEVVPVVEPTTFTVTVDDRIINSNGAATVVEGSTYYAEITHNLSDLKLYSVSYTMGKKSFVVMASNDKAVIDIEAVNGNITIVPVFVSANVVASWAFDVDKTITGNGDWGDKGQTISVAHNGWYDSDSGKTVQTVTHGNLNTKIDFADATSTWADPGTIVGFKLPTDLEVGTSYILNLPLYAGNDTTTLIGGMIGSTQNGVDLVFTTTRPYNMWNTNDTSVTDIYKEGTGVLVVNSPCIGNLTTDENNIYRIAVTVTEEIAAYAKVGNYLTVIVHHQLQGGEYNLGNVTLEKITKVANVTTELNMSVSNGATMAQIGKSYTAQIHAKPGNKITRATYFMNGSETVEITVNNGVAELVIPEVTGDIAIEVKTEQLEKGNILTNGTFMQKKDFWSFGNGVFTIVENGGSDIMNDPAYLLVQGADGGLMYQSFAVEKDTNYELTFRYKGDVPADASLWGIASKNSFAYNSVIYKATEKKVTEWTEVKVVFNSGSNTTLFLVFRNDSNSNYCLDNIWVKETTGEANINLYNRPILGTRPNPSPYDEYPFICDEEDNLFEDGGFELGNHEITDDVYAKVDDTDAWSGNNSLHYDTSVEGDGSNLLINGDFANGTDNWVFYGGNEEGNVSVIEVEGEHGNVLKYSGAAVENNGVIALYQKLTLNAGYTYKFSYDFYNQANWGAFAYIGQLDENGEPVYKCDWLTMNKDGADGTWTTKTATFTPNTDGEYIFYMQLCQGSNPGKEMYVDNLKLELISVPGNPRLDYEMTVEANTDYWLTLMVKTKKYSDVFGRFLTFGITDPDTGDFIMMADPEAEGGRPYKVNQQLTPSAYDGQWHIITVPFNSGDMTHLNFTINGTNIEAWFDDIYIFKAEDAKSYVAPESDKDEATVTDRNPELLGTSKENNLFSNMDLSEGNSYWGATTYKYGVFGNSLNIVNSGSSIYGFAMHYAATKIPTNTYYIKWIDVEPNTEYTFSAKYAIVEAGDGFVGLINGYKVGSEVSENRLFPSLIAEFSFDGENYKADHSWQTIAVSFNTGERNRIGFVVCDAGGEAYIDELRLFKTSDGTELETVVDNFPTELKPEKNEVVISNDTVNGLEAGTTLKELLESFDNAEYIRVFNQKGEEITSADVHIGTGYMINLMDGPAIKDSAVVVIKGDITGDGVLNDEDAISVIRYLSGAQVLEGVYLSAADVDGDGKITVSDATLNRNTPEIGTATFKVSGPNAFAQRDKIEIVISADSDSLRAVAGKLIPTAGLTFVKAESELDGWELSVMRDGTDVKFAMVCTGGKPANTGDALITLTYQVGMISTYDEAQLAIEELTASTGTDLLSAEKLNWMRQAPVQPQPDTKPTVPQDPVIEAARNRLKELKLEGIEISPEFDPEIKEYTATVPFEVDKVVVTAIAADEDAVVTIGDTNLEYVGRNTVAIRVVSADGLQRTYKIVITREMPVEDTTPSEPNEPSTEPNEPSTEPTKPDVVVPEEPNDGVDVVKVVLLSLSAVVLGAIIVILYIILKRRNEPQEEA